MKFVDYLSLQVYPEMLLRIRSSLYLWMKMHWHGIGYVMIWGLGITNDWNWNFIRSFILCILFIVSNYIYFFWPREGESITQAWGRLKSMLYSCPNHELSREIIIQIFMLGFLTMIAPCSILIVLVLLWRRILNSNGTYWKELNATLKIGNSRR